MDEAIKIDDLAMVSVNGICDRLAAEGWQAVQEGPRTCWSHPDREWTLNTYAVMTIPEKRCLYARLQWPYLTPAHFRMRNLERKLERAKQELRILKVRQMQVEADKQELKLALHEALALVERHAVK